MKKQMMLDPVLFMQAEIANLYCRREKLSPSEFLELDKKYGILDFIALGYEPFHLTGNEGILDEIRSLVKTRKRNKTTEQLKRQNKTDKN
jgi:hypothetical protein